MRPILALAAASFVLLGEPALAQGVPPNPFASNYPSAPPRTVDRDGRSHVPRARRAQTPERFERGLLPPADVPGR